MDRDPTPEGSAWLAEDTATTRPYALTGGRTRPGHPLGLGSHLRVDMERPGLLLQPEGAQVLALCRLEPRSVAELAARLRLPVQVTKVILSDLIDSHVLAPTVPPRDADGGDPNLLEAVLVGLRSL
ncbi:DUF742 domain-containing protein [Streptomyces sp. NPDC102360]|uniref:DUF742 domain-containing protein n=1 Tax=Streptomyces sp. NPDC102360 TaxID=3366160 RepID=UPI003825A7BB